MNVFENLIDELKEENLIEDTVIETPKEDLENNKTLINEPVQKSDSAQGKIVSLPANNADLILPENESDFYRRRAMEEVSALQMVERVFLGVEREYLKIIPKPYDDIPVSKALHDFLQISKSSSNPDNAAAEFKLMQETESWYSALAQRDQNILPAQLRRFCETTRPVLSAQALAALARFYRNSPFSETVRSKFDLVITRFFSKEIGDEKRILAFELNEISQHLSDLYADWSSVSLYSTDDDSQLTIISLKFEDFITEAATAESFEELIKNDFFNRLRAFKVSTGENFYAPQVTSTAIKCNVLVGNRFVELLNQERENNNAPRLEDKYKFLLDQSISEAASKTLQLVELLQNRSFEKPENGEADKIHKKQVIKQDSGTKTEKPKRKSFSFLMNGYGVSKWLIGLMAITLLATAGLYFWVEFAAPKASTNEVKTLEMEVYYFKDYLKVAKITNSTLIGVIKPSWNQAEEEKKKEVLKNILIVGKDKGFRSVRLLDDNGKTVGYISADSITKNNSN